MTSRAARFVSYCAEHADTQPAVRAALRSGLGRPPEQCDRMHRYLAPWLSRHGDAHHERAWYTVASLIARTPATAVPQPSPGDLGDSLALAALYRELAPRTCSRYLQLLTRQPPESVCRHVTTAVLALRDKGVPVDFARLLHHLLDWPSQQDVIAKTWSLHYFQTAPDETTGDGAD